MRIVIITEGNNKIGFGHITRCLSLYQAFKEKGLTVKFIVNGNTTIESLLTNTDYILFNWLKDPFKLFQLLNNSDIVIIDSYLAEKELYQRISESVALSVYIDDNQRINYPPGILINGSIRAEKISYPTSNKTHYLLGSQYIPLRRQFWNVGEKKINTFLQNVMITFGGDDIRNLTLETMKMLTTYYPSLNKKVIIGKGFKKISQIEKLKDDKTELIYYPNAEGMLEVMLESDIAISAAGQTLYELARVGLPTIAIGVANNQTQNLKNWGKAGFIEIAGFWEDEKLQHHILEKLDLLKNRNLRIKMFKNGKKFVDGKGALKIVKYCLNQYYAEKISLRPLKKKDIYNIFELSNENDVRQNSFDEAKIPFKDHRNWFKNKLEDPENLFLVITIEKDFAGQIRFDFNVDSATISISIKKPFRELGLGKLFIKKSIEYLKINSPHIKIIKAYIKENNKKSLKLFKNMNFTYEKNVSIKNHNAFEYIYKIRD